jgi:FtsP/CotA-like multicopper oxidase with cupredoxin domain
MNPTAPIIVPLLCALPYAVPEAATSSRFGPGVIDTIAANDNRYPAGRLDRNVLTLRLTVQWGLMRPEGPEGPGVATLAFTEVGRMPQVPGPLIRVPQGTEIRVSFHNPLPDSTITVYGLAARPITSDTGVRIPGGGTHEFRFRAGVAGTYYYRASVTERELDRDWLDSQLAGALIVDPPHGATNDRIFVITGWRHLEDSSLAVPKDPQGVLMINGLSWPHTERLGYTQGDSVQWRWINASVINHPMHLHGFYYRIESRGDWRSEQAYRREERPLVVTNLMRPGETMRVGWLPERAGNWIFHCHFAFHVSHHLILGRSSMPTTHGSGHAPHAMAGLVLGISVQPKAGVHAASVSASAGPARKIRLLAQSAPKRFGPLTGLGYVVQDGRSEPAPDSIAIPGPVLVLQRGEPVRITVVNLLEEPTAVHWHGIELQSFPDGVPDWSGSPGRIMPPIAPGDSFVAEFVPPRAGTFIYHAHANEQYQLGAGLYGALLVVDRDHPFDPDIDRLIVVGGGGPADSLPWFGFESPGLVNGSGDPPPMDFSTGKTYRFRLININPDWRVIFSLMSDSGLVKWRPIAKDGADLPSAQRGERPAYLLTGPGETAEFEFTPTTAGELRFEAKTKAPGWIIPIVARVR